MATRWYVTTIADFDGMAAQAGVSASALRAAGFEARVVVGWVDAETKGEAITRARQRYPMVPARYLNVAREGERA